MFILNSVLFGVGLAMDAFSVSLANGLHEPKMSRSRMCGIAGVFALFQALMPLAGWFCVHSLVRYFRSFENFVPWIALILLGYIGGKMVFESVRGECEVCPGCVSYGALLLQGVATSIDAFSVGFTISEYHFFAALVEALIIAAVTFLICMLGLLIGKKAGSLLSGKAGILGGIILIFIGVEIFVTNIFPL